MGTVYLIHFARPFKHARHYIGYTDNLEARMRYHREGKGSRLMDAVTRAGIPWEVVQTWEGDRHMERRLHNWKGAGRFCLTCMKGGDREAGSHGRRVEPADP